MMSPFSSWLPSLSGAVSYIPTISLPTNIQRRFLAFVLKRALGHLVKGGQVDAAKIEADVASGRAEVRDLELDEQAINALLVDLPLTFTSGKVERVSAICQWPIVWNSDIRFDVDDLELSLSLPSTKPPRPPRSPGDGDQRHHRHMNASVVSVVADEFIKEELGSDEEKELEKSVRSSIYSEYDPNDMPGGFDVAPRPPRVLDPSTAAKPVDDRDARPENTTELPVVDPKANEVTMIAGLMESILSRLCFSAKNIKILIKYQDSLADQGDRGGDQEVEMELRIQQISYAEEEGSVPGSGVRTTTTTKVLKISSTEVWMKITPLSELGLRDSTVETSSSSSNSSDDMDPTDEIMMSQSIADLMNSTISSATSSAYFSATGEDDQSDGDSGDGDGSTVAGRSKRRGHARKKSAEPKSRQVQAGSGEGISGEWLKVFSMGSDDLVARLSTTRPGKLGSANKPTTDSQKTEDASAEATVQPSTTTKLHLEVSIGMPTLLLLPSQTLALLSLVEPILYLVSHESNGTSTLRPAGTPNPSNISVEARVRAINVVLGYGDDVRNAKDVKDCAPKFWAHPSSVNLPLGCFRIRLDRLGLAMRQESSPIHPPHDENEGRTSPAPTVELTLSDFSILEIVPQTPLSTPKGMPSPFREVPTASTAPPIILPLLISDPNLSSQYDTPPSSKPFTSFASVDWMEVAIQHSQSHHGVPGSLPPFSSQAGLPKISLYGRDWRLKGKGKKKHGQAVSVSGPAENAEHLGGVGKAGCLVVGLYEDSVRAALLPLHLFVDCSLVERILPFARQFGSRLQASSFTGRESDVTPPATPRVQRRPSLDESSTTESPSAGQNIEVDLAMIRCEIRCPAPVTDDDTSPRRAAMDASLRSGITILDVREISLSTRSEASLSSTIGNLADDQAMVDLRLSNATLFFLAKDGIHANAFLSVSSFDGGTQEDFEETPIPPTVRILPSSSASQPSRLSIALPMVRTDLHKDLFDGLQLWADDLTQWAGRALADEDGLDREPGAKVIGSRFFGSKSIMAGNRLGHESSEFSLDGQSPGLPAVTGGDVKITQFHVSLHVPAISRPGKDPKVHLITLVACDVATSVDMKAKEIRNDLVVKVACSDILINDETTTTDVKTILARQTGRSLTSFPPPVLSLSLTSSTEPQSGMKESQISLMLDSFTYFLRPDLTWLEDLAAFSKSPEGAFETVVPSERTRIKIELLNVGLHLTAPKLPARFVLTVGHVLVKLDLVPHLLSTSISISASHVSGLLIDDVADAVEANRALSSSFDFWTTQGYVRLVHVQEAETMVKIGKGQTLPDLEVILERLRLRVTLCPDSVATLGQVAGDLASFVEAQAQEETDRAPNRKARPLTMTSSRLFGTIDQNAFRAMMPKPLPIDMIDDDVPSNIEYLGSGPSHPQSRSSKARAKHDPTSNRHASSDLEQVISDIDGETIRLFNPKGLRILDGYYKTPRLRDDNEIRPSASVIRVRTKDCDVSIRLHEGYDWVSTRRTIEEETKNVRRRLVKIRQLLAEGQMPDDRLEGASRTLFNSIHLGVPEDADDLDSMELLDAVNKELDDAETSSQTSATESQTGSWETLPSASNPPVSKIPKPRRKRTHLTRSSAFAIEINLRSIELNLDILSPDQQMSTVLALRVGDLNIIDNIRTSTWRKFLTELRPHDGGTPRPTGAPMMRLEVKILQPSGTSSRKEALVKMKLSPLRLYIDQDALDYLKAFAAFQESVAPPPRRDAKSEGGLFLQHVEILPIKIKLDYKPKRVDYRGLRQGRAIELMNFFHFEASEMTLRHITITGVDSFARLSDILQDIWTPDVKANQLAGFLAGISPVRQVVNLGSGVADLILLPVEQFQKDGRLGRGIQRGASSFAKTTALEAVRLGARLATGTQVVLEQAEAVLGARFGTSVTGETIGDDDVVDGKADDPQAQISRYAEQPADLREGLGSAYKSLSGNLRSAAQTILAVPMEVYERAGTEGPVRAVVKAVPIAVLRPMIGASEAVGKALSGLQNTMEPTGYMDREDKYKRRR